jgi:hypothetical protein
VARRFKQIGQGVEVFLAGAVQPFAQDIHHRGIVGSRLTLQHSRKFESQWPCRPQNVAEHV